MDEDEWPPPEARVQSAIWRAEGCRGLEAQEGDDARARRQLGHARRRLGRQEPRLVKLVERVRDS